jgi:hypothetical protein
MNYRGNNNESCLPENPKFRQNYGFQDMLRRKSKFVKITLYTDKTATPIQYLPSLAEMIKADIWTITITRLIEWRNGQTYFYAAYTEK